jgi:hypothetical protein
MRNDLDTRQDGCSKGPEDASFPSVAIGTVFLIEWAFLEPASIPWRDLAFPGTAGSPEGKLIRYREIHTRHARW